MRNIFVRINNQIDYSLFNIPNSEGIVIGKEGYLFEKDYIRTCLGKDFLGKSVIDKKLLRTKFIQEFLKTKNIDLIIVFEPGKASFFPQSP